MNILTRIIGATLCLAVIGLSPVLLAADKEDGDKQQGGKTTAPAEAKKQVSSSGKKQQIPVYVPPRRGAPLARVGGGTRGISDELPFISVITPEDTGYTSTRQPVLYWYISESMQTHFEFALINEDEIDPIIEVTTDEDMKAGLNSLDLADVKVSLKPGVSYQWSVALVADVDKRSSDVVSSGQIELLELTDEQKARLGTASPQEAVMIYASEGYWYDTFATLSDLISKDPDNAALREQRKSLLRQIDLEEAARVE